MAMRYLDEDLVRIRGTYTDFFNNVENSDRVVQVRYWGDQVDLVDPSEADDEAVRDVRVRYWDYPSGKFREGSVQKRRSRGKNLPLGLLPVGATRPLAVTFVDVQQGDATFIRTPDDRKILIDGEEEVFIARLLAPLYPGTSAARPLMLDAVVVTHGDADHFEGLAALAEAAAHSTRRKRIHTRIARCLHNGLVKKPERVPDGSGGTQQLKERERFGDPVSTGGQHYIVDLHDDPSTAPDPNGPFTRWNGALRQFLAPPADYAATPSALGEVLPVLRRVAAGTDDALATFADSGLAFEVMGPIEESVGSQAALEVLRDDGGRQSASHTVNGHSVILRATFGNGRFLFGGDLNRNGATKVSGGLGRRRPRGRSRQKC